LIESAQASIHAIGIGALVLIFVVGTLRPINLGVLALAATFLIGTLVAGEPLGATYSGFPVDLFVLLAGVTYLFGIAAQNGTIEWLVALIVRAVGEKRALIPWIVFAVAAVPTSAGALGSVGVALLAPIALRLALRYDLDRRLIGLMTLHGAACGNFSPLNVLGAIVAQGVDRGGLELSTAALFAINVAYNLLLGTIIYTWFGGRRLATPSHGGSSSATPVAATHAARADVTSTVGPRANETSGHERGRLGADRLCTLLALVFVAVAALAYGFNIGFLALLAAAALHLAFPTSSSGAERRIAWDVVLLICGIVTYVSALQRYGTVDAIGDGIAGLGSPLLSALLICLVGAMSSAFASSAGILGAMIVLAMPFLSTGSVGVTGLVTALAISATVVDSSPFSTAGALVVANTPEADRTRVYRALLLWGGIMAITAPLATWLLLVVPGT